MATFYDYFNEQKYADAVKNVSNACGCAENPAVLVKAEALHPRMQYCLSTSKHMLEKAPDN